MSDREPSVTITVMPAVPFQFASGVSVRLVPTTSVVTAEVSEEAVNSKLSSSTSEATRFTSAKPSSKIYTPSIAVMMGASLTGVTIISILSSAMALP